MQYLTNYPKNQNPAKPISLVLNVRIALLLGFFFGGQGCYAQGAELVKLEGLQQMIQNEKEQIQVVNFWATWCAPCIKELPLLEKLNSDRKDVRVRLVSMDMDLDPDPEKVRKFVARKKILSQVLILDERNPNQWIDQLDKN